MNDPKQRQNWSAFVILAAADTDKEIVAAPQANKRHVVTKLHVISQTAAAQIVNFRSGVGGTIIYQIPPNFTANLVTGFDLDKGLPLDTATAFTAVPVAAGPRMSIVAEGYTELVGNVAVP